MKGEETDSFGSRVQQRRLLLFSDGSPNNSVSLQRERVTTSPTTNPVYCSTIGSRVQQRRLLLFSDGFPNNSVSLLLFDAHPRRLLRMYYPGHAWVKGNDSADILTVKLKAIVFLSFFRFFLFFLFLVFFFFSLFLFFYFLFFYCLSPPLSLTKWSPVSLHLVTIQYCVSAYSYHAFSTLSILSVSYVHLVCSSSLKGRERAIVNLTNIRTIALAFGQTPDDTLANETLKRTKVKSQTTNVLAWLPTCQLAFSVYGCEFSVALRPQRP